MDDLSQLSNSNHPKQHDDHNDNDDDKYEEAQAKVEIWRLVFGFVEMAVVKCAIQLKIPEALDGPNPVTLDDLASATSSDPKLLFRVMRFLINRKIFKQKGLQGYVHSALSRLLMRNEVQNMSDLVMMESSPVMLEPWHYLSRYLTGNVTAPFVGAHNVDVWSYAASNPDHSNLISRAMACDARVSMSGVVNGCIDVFEGVTSVVDVGGADGTALSVLVNACPWIHGINFDLPHVVSTGIEIDNVVHVGGDMFQQVPKADVAFIKWVLHDWSDDDCIKILTKCREAVTNKVIIMEAVLDDEPADNKSPNKLKDVGLILDMCMMAHTNNGKERTLSEWTHIVNCAGFSSLSVKAIPGAIQSLIEAFP